MTSFLTYRAVRLCPLATAKSCLGIVNVTILY